VRAHRRLHDVDDDVAGVDQHPLGGLLALDADDCRACGRELGADRAGERLHLPVGFGGGDNERVVQVGELADVEDGDVAGLDIVEGGYGDLGELPFGSGGGRWV